MTSLPASRFLKWFFPCLILFLLPLRTVGQQNQEYRTLHVKLKENRKPSKPVSGNARRMNIEAVDRVNEIHQPILIKRIFPDAGVYEEAHKAYGLHLWYEIRLSKATLLRKALQDYRATDYFDIVEESEPYHAIREVKSSLPVDLSTLPGETNDPHFSSQWHFDNFGQSGGTPGADINLKDAWKIEAGSPKVIVAVIDEGIDKSHPDLKTAMWVNSDEIPNNGLDDDGNGYVDDINGYGFGDQSPIIRAGDHGTHVAGTIGAVTNDGIGVSGIAGGNGSDKGVLLMSCAGFGAFDNGGFEEAMVYAADNGAVISQNSWGGGSRAIEAAIDYFVERAGFDNTAANFSNNIQTGPMAGGVVIFAAGNRNSNTGYPGQYEKVIAVASTDHNDVKSNFSNYGEWVDISAPGSDVFSTIRSGYGSMSGTSMACPHVSGVAALIVSNLQRIGLKPNQIWNRLRFSASSIDSQNPGYINQLGWGRLDAFVALKEPDLIPPGAIDNLQAIEIHSTSLTLTWTASGESDDEGQAAEYEIRYATTPIDADNFAGATLIDHPPLPPQSGETVSFELKALTPSTKYYFALKSIDVFENISPLSNVISATTLTLPTPELLSATLDAQLYTGALVAKNIRVKNIGDEEELLVRVGVPHIEQAPVRPPLGATGRLFAINSTSNRIDELNTTSGQIVRSIPLPEPSSRTKEGLAFDGVHLYYGKSKLIYKINATTGEVVRTFDVEVASSINGLAWSGEYLYVSCYNGNTSTTRTLQVDSDNGEVLNSLVLWSELGFYAKNNSLLICDYGHVEERNLTNGDVIRVIDVGSNPKCVASSYIDGLIFVSDEWDTEIKALNGDGTLRYTIPYPVTTALAGDENPTAWLESREEVFSIPPGQIGEIPITFNSAGLSPSTWNGLIKVIPLNSNTPPLPVSVSLNVLDGTDIETARIIDFKTQYLGLEIDTTIVIENRGSTNLVINEISVNDTRVTSSLSSATISPGNNINVTIKVHPVATGIIDATLTIKSNDPDESILSIPVKAIIENAPQIAIAPESLHATLLTGETTSSSFTITNSGAALLRWNVQLAGSASDGIELSGTSSDSTIRTGVDEFSLKASSPESLTGLVYDPDSELIYAKSYGGNRFYKYNIALDNWTESGFTPENFDGQGTFLNGKVYFGGSRLNIYDPTRDAWSSASFPVTGSAVSLTSDGKYVFVAIAKSIFRFDPGSEGWSELPAAPTAMYIGGFASLSYHSGIIYATGLQYITGDGNTAFYKYLINSNTWIQSNSIEGKLSTGSAVDPASAKFYGVGESKSGERIQLSVLDIRSAEWSRIAMPFVVSEASGLVHVGKPGASGVYVIQGYGEAFGFYETPSGENWISVTPKSGIASEGQTQTVTVKLNAHGLFAGLYTADIRVFSTQPNIEKRIPLELTVIGAPEILLNKSQQDVGNVIVGSNRAATVTIRNRGTAELSVNNIIVNNPDFYLLAGSGEPISSFVIPVGESRSLTAVFKPEKLGEETGVFTFEGNVPGGKFQFLLKGTGIDPASLIVPADTIKVQLFSGEEVTKKFSIQNEGNGDTQYLVVYGHWPWIHIDSAGRAVNIKAHQTREFEAIVSAAGMSAGIYNNVIVVEDYLDASWDERFEIPVQMTVKDAPYLTLIDSVDFGERFVNGEYDSILQVTNSGTQPLVISSIEMDNPAFSLPVTTPFTLDPGQNKSISIGFNPVAVAEEVAHVTFTTNQPLESSRNFIIKGEGVHPPSFQSSRSQINISAFQGETSTESMILTNSGGSVLKYKIDNQSTLQPSSDDGFTNLAETPLDASHSIRLTAVTSDPATGILYAQYLWYQDLYSYNPQTNTWSEVGNAAPKSGNSIGGATILDSKLYSVFSDEPNNLHVYDMLLKSWTSLTHNLGIASASITSDGNLIYIAGSGKFAAYNRKTKSWLHLKTPHFILDGLGGLGYVDGHIYAHSANSTGFARYNIALSTWENLVPVPNEAINGNAIDPVRKRYYAYSENFLYEYDIANNVWTVLYIPTFKISNTGGMTYLSKPGFEAVYFIQGEYERGIAKYEPKNELPWLRTSHLIGDVESQDNFTIGINCNASNLEPGVYNGKIQLSTNDPNDRSPEIPVTFTVRPSAPSIKVSELISATVHHDNPTVLPLVIENSGKEILNWTISETLPPWLSLNKSSGDVLSKQSQIVEITFTPTLFTGGALADFVIQLSTNDPTLPKSSTQLMLTIANGQPFLISPIPDQILGEEGVEISLPGHFSDPDDDELMFHVTMSKEGYITNDLIGGNLIMRPLKSGDLTVTVTATDRFNSSTSSSFEVSNIVTGFEGDIVSSPFTVSPNPFSDKLTVHLANTVSGKTKITFVDLSGRNVYTTRELHLDHHTEFEITGVDLPQGLYACILYVNNKLVYSTRVVKE